MTQFAPFVLRRKGTLEAVDTRGLSLVRFAGDRAMGQVVTGVWQGRKASAWAAASVQGNPR